MIERMQVSVIIVNYNVRYFIEQCILSVLAASNDRDVEIIVVDNQSTDGSAAFIKKKYPKVVLIENTINIGFSAANNQGVKAAKGEFVLILNPDTVVPEDIFEILIDFYLSRPNCGIVGVKLIDGAGKFLPESKRGIPTPRVSFNKLFGISSKQTGKYYATHISEDETGIVDILVGALMFLKRDVYNEVNGFDESYFMYGEDIDLSYKVLLKGYQNYYCSKLSVLHYKGESTKKDIAYLNYFHKAMKIFYKRYFKLNKMYDFLMSAGIEMWFLLKFYKFKFYKNKPGRAYSKILFVGDSNGFSERLEQQYTVEVSKAYTDVAKLKKEILEHKIEAVIFDNSSYSNKQILTMLNGLKDENVIFKIHPHTTDYIIGSECNINRGEVEHV